MRSIQPLKSAISWNTIFSGTFSKKKAIFEKEFIDRRVHDRHHALKKQKKTGDISSIFSEGDMRLYRLCKNLEMLSEKLYPMESYQTIALNLYINAVLPQIYKTEWDDKQESIRALLGISEKIKQGSVVVMPRRYGKTEVTTRFAACFMLCYKDTTVRYYSQGLRQSLTAMENMRKMVGLLIQDKEEATIEIRNQEKLFVHIGADKSDYSMAKFFGFPASLNGQRGSGAVGDKTLDLAIADEFMHWEPGIYNKAFVPTNVKAGSSVIMITTYNMTDRSFETLLQPVIKGKTSVISSFRLQGACGACIMKRNLSDCKHVERPSFHSDENLDLVKQLINDDEALAVETFGVRVGGGSTPALEKEDLAYLFKDDFKVFIRDKDKIKRIFVTIDPSWGGTKSEYALVSKCTIDDKLVVIGADSVRSSDSMVCTKMVSTHLIQLGKMYPSATFYTCIESNLGSEPGILYRELSREQSINYKIVVFSDSKSFMGPRTTQLVKMLATEAFISNLKKQNIRFAKDFYTQEKKHLETINKMNKQLLEYRKVVKDSVNLYQEIERVSFTGKTSGVCDDYVICLTLNDYYNRQSQIFSHHNVTLSNLIS